MYKTNNIDSHITDKEKLFRRNEMKKGKKNHWSFKCSPCNEKISSKTHSEYFLFNWDHLAIGLIIDEPFCSMECMYKYFDKNKIDIDAAIKEHNDLMDMWDDLENEK